MGSGPAAALQAVEGVGTNTGMSLKDSRAEGHLGNCSPRHQDNLGVEARTANSEANSEDSLVKEGKNSTGMKRNPNRDTAQLSRPLCRIKKENKFEDWADPESPEQRASLLSLVL